MVITTLTLKQELLLDLWPRPPVCFSKHLCDESSRYSATICKLQLLMCILFSHVEVFIKICTSHYHHFIHHIAKIKLHQYAGEHFSSNECNMVLIQWRLQLIYLPQISFRFINIRILNPSYLIFMLLMFRENKSMKVLHMCFTNACSSKDLFYSSI